MVENDPDVSNYYGIWPTIIGLAFGFGLIAFMFWMADGFTH